MKKVAPRRGTVVSLLLGLPLHRQPLGRASALNRTARIPVTGRNCRSVLDRDRDRRQVGIRDEITPRIRQGERPVGVDFGLEPPSYCRVVVLILAVGQYQDIDVRQDHASPIRSRTPALFVMSTPWCTPPSPVVTATKGLRLGARSRPSRSRRASLTRSLSVRCSVAAHMRARSAAARHRCSPWSSRITG